MASTTPKHATSSHLVLALVFMLGVIVTMQQRRGSRPASLGSSGLTHRERTVASDSRVASGDVAANGKAPGAVTSSSTMTQQSLEELLDEVRREDEAKERIPALMRRPVKRPRQSMNNLTSGKYWAQGSWGRVIASSSACWAHPAVDSFAVQCTKKLLPPVVVITVEHLASLKVIKTDCTSCRAVAAARSGGSADAPSVEVKMLARGGGGGGAEEVDSNDESSAFSVGAPIPRARMTTATFAVEAKPACMALEQSFQRSCVIKIDLLFRVVEAASSGDASKNAKRNNKVTKMGPPPPEVCFITMGDWGTQQLEQTQVAETLVDVVQRRMVKFLISTGDNFYPTGVQSLSDQQWLSVFERPYAHVALQRLRWFICAGNHDQWGLPPQKEYGLEHPRWYMPHYHYNTSIPLYRDVAKNSLDTIELAVMNTAGREMHQQLEMVDTFFSTVEERHGGYLMDLSRHWRFVVNHEPLFSGGIHGSSARGKLLRATFQPYMQQSLVHAYFNGDDHFLEIHRANGTDYFTSGAGGGSVRYYTVEAMNDTAIYQMPMENRESVRGFMLHCVKEGLMHTTLIDGISGKILFKYKTKYFVDLSEFQLE